MLAVLRQDSFALPCTWTLYILAIRGTSLKNVRIVYTTVSTYGCSLHYDGHYFRIFTEWTLHPLHIPQEWIVDWNGNLVRSILLASTSLHGPTGSCTDHRCDIVNDTEDAMIRFFDRDGKNVYNISGNVEPGTKGVCTDGRILYVLDGGNVAMSDKKGNIIRSWPTGQRTAYDLTTDGKYIYIV